MASRVAVVTGSNKGIGYAIVKQLSKEFSGIVILTARDSSRGQEAASKLNSEGYKCEFHLLDITSKPSVEDLKNHLVKHYGGLDVLINNAAMAFKMASTAPFSEQAEISMKTNFYGTLNVCQVLLPILKPNARVINIASYGGRLNQVNEDLQKRFSSEECSEEDLCQLVDEFVSDVKEGKHKEKGWSNSAYGMSKLATIALTNILARKESQTGPEGVLVNSCCPGWCKTDMAGDEAPDTPEQGADTPCYLAMIPDGAKEPHGKFLRKRSVADWLTAEIIS